MGHDLKPVEVDKTIVVEQSAYSTMVQNVKVSANLGREELWEMGRKAPYQKYVNFPQEFIGVSG